MERMLEGYLARAWRAHGRSNRTLCMRLAAPLAPAERLLMLPGYDSKIFWSPSTDEENSGVGAAHVLIAAGTGRFAQIRDAAARAFTEIVEVGTEINPELRFFGGFSFESSRFDSSLWRGFGDAQFVLPRITYTRRAQRAWLTLSASEEELSSVAGRKGFAGEADRALEALRCEGDGAASELKPTIVTEGIEDIWTTLVKGILGEIAAGRLEKAVAARHLVLRGSYLPAPAQILERLRRAERQCMRFAITVGNRTFLGASPERIVKCLGRHVWTEALAGSVHADQPAHGTALFLSRKNRAEHAIVAREIRASLEPLYESLNTYGPYVHRLRHVSHLRTRFKAILKQPQHVLDLVARLHPTPAVGGTPRIAALAWLAQHEHAERGFYAGPFGAFDRNGNGEFAVAIRSGLIGANEAHLFAGAGIVEGSDVQSELGETRWKLQGLMAAMGVG